MLGWYGVRPLLVLSVLVLLVLVLLLRGADQYIGLVWGAATNQIAVFLLWDPLCTSPHQHQTWNIISYIHILYMI